MSSQLQRASAHVQSRGQVLRSASVVAFIVASAAYVTAIVSGAVPVARRPAHTRLAAVSQTAA
jgi:hypothetical protein